MTKHLRGASAGVAAAGIGIAVAELFAAVARPAAGPLVTVGAAVIDATPTPVKEFAVRELGTYDKPVLLATIGLVVAAYAAMIGILGQRRRPVIVAGTALFGALGATAALSRPTGTLPDTLPSLLAATVAGATLWWLLGHIGRPTLTNRRSFLRGLALVAGAAVLAEGGAQIVRRTVGRIRTDLRLPVPQSPAEPLPSGIGPGFTTPSADFYRVDTALTVPRVDPDTWSLRIHGMVGTELRLSLAELLARPMIERDITLNCVSNEVGGPYIGTARWLGVPLGPLLKQAGLDAGADQIVARSVEGMTIGTPIATALDGRDTMLAVAMNGEPLRPEHGFPVRMLTPGLYGYAGACKWVAELEVTTFAAFDAYWVEREWAPGGEVKTASRIDRPLPFARPDAGPVTVAGVAWAQGRGITGVEIRVDGGEWQAAELLPVPSADTWVQWRYRWQATRGPHSLSVRATDGTGAVQIEERATPFPSGATGWHTITVTVA
ncbi:molybdopterin-dependent oxidoreductase [Actinoplanes derwentensis]|uniref:DMSO/TMAO reductase YedYZ, molybdopterin-dependent catalytic subunit n=1 Tax=Actinoplanes derwentensis TaxID=113562 RepID=A0A1H2CWI3_9ACTN|nr:molybdopterin-dependent oxidoreductase [Actinoplanes derwentensis]GID87870.1 oxidoreductase [Actinoplanes derwentensis]SDT74865.1 DMSO/TMAO reductase YedYZ, molybdopterin-dependent catalytic subunit [Actinoplanes derwentensis]